MEIFDRWSGVEFVKRRNEGRKRALVGGRVETTVTEYMLRRAKQDIIIRF